MLGIGLPDMQETPSAMRASNGQGMEWRMVVASRPDPQQRIRLVARAGGSTYFADASTLFLQAKEGEQLQR